MECIIQQFNYHILIFRREIGFRKEYTYLLKKAESTKTTYLVKGNINYYVLHNAFYKLNLPYERNIRKTRNSLVLTIIN